MNFDCKLEQRQAQPVMYIRERSKAADLPQFFAKSYQSIANYIESQGGRISGAPYAAYYNMDMENLDVEAGIPIIKPVSNTDQIKTGEIPAGDYATTVHEGPYSDVEPAYNALMQWMKEHGYATTGVSYEFYLNDPGSTPSEQLLTQILFPLQ
jgi:effector-binding domain-containing protein